MKHINTVITDLSVTFCSSPGALAKCSLKQQTWNRIDKDLYLHASEQNAWIYLEETNEADITNDSLVITDIHVGQAKPDGGLEDNWEHRTCGIWVLRTSYSDDGFRILTAIDVLFGTDAVEPRPGWMLLPTSLQLEDQPDVPAPRLSVRFGRPKSRPDDASTPLSVNGDGTFKIVQISDTHMVTGPGVCNDAIDADGQPLPSMEADPHTVEFLGAILDLEKPNLVILSGDQVHHDVPDTQSPLFKVVSPLISRSIPFAAVFGNHDDEGTHALSRKKQMSILQDLPFCLAQPGPESIDGVGNYHLQVFSHDKSEVPVATLFFLDSHGQISSKIKNPDYDPIQQSQINWFTSISQDLRKSRIAEDGGDFPHLSLAFMHIPFPEYARNELLISGGKRREPTEGPSSNTHFYDALVQEEVAAVGCGHDHVNDFCALLPDTQQGLSAENGDQSGKLGPWLCYNGGSGFGGYCSYDENRYYRRTRVWEIDTKKNDLKTWKRIEYSNDRFEELILVEGGRIIAPSTKPDVGHTCISL
ncbi:phosphatase DCR2 [Colletotrichum orchidophilum]|uniref:Phosphatase DCR2 n=1 Tax=Colletotrichum orchidophilum TaxID=1209926 RepID=A0A1G4AUI2_9PEZI|nr:phosphatase DCR2 [Colletotrichum orchidophilum]OHE92743.1 phosphatase DCR2 [Colletotrichum orchidophilum]